MSATDARPATVSTASTWPRNLPPHLRPVRRLGAGGTASVWLARDRRSGRHVAVKLVALSSGPGGAVGAPIRRDRFEREARALARLGGRPGVPTVLGLGVDPTGVAWLVSEFVVGPTIADRVLGGEALDADEVVVVLAGTADALAAAHADGVVHGDVSPANIVLGSTGPVLVDFGVGGLDGVSGDAALTPLVASPERLAGADPSAADDVHALAATVRWAVRSDASLPASIEGRLSACLQPVPEDRPSSSVLAGSVRADGRTVTRAGWGRRTSRR